MIYKSYLIENNLKNLDKKIYLFFGENHGLKEDIKNKIKMNFNNYEILLFNQDELMKDKFLLLNETDNLSLFKKNKIFILFDVNDKILDLIKNIELNLDENKIFLFADILDKKSKIRSHFEKSPNLVAVACYEDNEQTIKSIIKEKLKDFNGLDAFNINMIYESCNMDRVKLNNELSKIILFFQNKKIETENLELLLNITINTDFDTLKDTAFTGDLDKTNKLLSNTVIDSEKNIYYLNIINLRLNQLNEIRNNSTGNLEAAINDLRPPVFWKNKPNLLTQAKKWDKNKIANILSKTYDLEITFKSNQFIKKDVLIKNLLVEMCRTANL